MEFQPVDFSTMPISAIFVFHDPRNWALDVQVMIDVILSRGIIDRPRPLDSAPPVELVFCNPDLLWRSEFPRPRLGQGAFREAFQAVFKVSRFLLSEECDVDFI
jgi:ribonucleotide monophosphatase NagD (HAD superfamily)